MKTASTEYIDKLFTWNLEESFEREEAEDVEKSCKAYRRAADSVSAGLAEELWDVVCEYGQSRELKGFQDGFRLAFNLIKEAQA